MTLHASQPVAAARHHWKYDEEDDDKCEEAADNPVAMVAGHSFSYIKVTSTRVGGPDDTRREGSIYSNGTMHV